MSVYTPRPYQPIITNAIIDTPRVNIFAGMGLGKTAGVLDAIVHLWMFGQVQRVLVIGPKRVAKSTWSEAVEKFSESFGMLSVAVAIGTPEERHAAIRAGAVITTINYDNLQWLVENYGEDWPFDTVVADESTKLKGLRVSIQVGKKSGKQFVKGQGSVRAKALARVAITRVKRWINLTGTPAISGLDALWGQHWFVDGGTALGNSFDAFSKRFFSWAPGSTHKKPILVASPFAEEQIRKLIAPKTVSLDAKDWFDIKDPIVNVIKVPLPPKARKAYNEMAKELYTEIRGAEIEALNAETKSMKLLQIASGAAYTDDKGNWVEVHDEKIEALKSVVEEAVGMPVLVFYHFKSDKARILAAFPHAKVFDDKPQTMRDWQDGKTPMLLVHPASAGHGVDGLQLGSNICCFFSSNWNIENDAQAIERIGPTRQLQAGFDRAVFVYRLVGEDTVEESVIERGVSKVSVDIALRRSLRKTLNLQET